MVDPELVPQTVDTQDNIEEEKQDYMKVTDLKNSKPTTKNSLESELSKNRAKYWILLFILAFIRVSSIQFLFCAAQDIALFFDNSDFVGSINWIYYFSQLIMTQAYIKWVITKPLNYKVIIFAVNLILGHMLISLSTYCFKNQTGFAMTILGLLNIGIANSLAQSICLSIMKAYPPNICFGYQFGDGMGTLAITTIYLLMSSLIGLDLYKKVMFLILLDFVMIFCQIYLINLRNYASVNCAGNDLAYDNFEKNVVITIEQTKKLFRMLGYRLWQIFFATVFYWFNRTGMLDRLTINYKIEASSNSGNHGLGFFDEYGYIAGYISSCLGFAIGKALLSKRQTKSIKGLLGLQLFFMGIYIFIYGIGYQNIYLVLVIALMDGVVAGVLMSNCHYLVMKDPQIKMDEKEVVLNIGYLMQFFGGIAGALLTLVNSLVIMRARK